MRRSMKVIAWVLGGLAIVAMLLVGAVFIVGNTDAGRSGIERLTNRLTQGHVKLSGLTGTLPHHLIIDKLELSDGRGIWLTARSIVLDWTPLAYLEKRLQIDKLQVASVYMQRLPQSSGPSSSAKPSIPRIDAAEVSIGVLQLDAQLAGAPASLAVRGSAHLRSLSDMLFDAAARRIDGDGEYELHLRFDAKRMDASLQLHEPASGPLENILSLPGLGALDATLSLKGPRDAEQLEISLQAGSLHGHAQGNFNLSQLSADLDVALSAGAMTPRPDLAWQSIALQGHWRGSIESPTAEAHIEVDKLRLPGGEQAAALRAEVAADQGKAQLHATVSGLKIPGPAPRLLESDPLRIDASLRLDDPSRRLELTATHRLVSLSGEVVIAGKQSAAFMLRIPELAPFAALAGQAVHGSAILNTKVDGYPKATRLNIDADAVLKPGAEFWAGVVGDRAKFQLSGVLSDGNVHVDAMKFFGRAVSLGASGDINEKSIRVSWDGQLADLNLVSSILAGSLHAAGSLDGPMTSLGLAARATSTVSVRGAENSTLSAEIKLRGLPKATSGVLVANGSLVGAPLQLDVAVDHLPGALRVLIRRADWRSAHAEGNLAIGTVDSRTEGKLTLNVGELKDLQPLLGVDFAGALSGELDLNPEGSRTRARLHFEGKDIVTAGLSGSVHASGDGFLNAFPFSAGAEIPDLRGAHANLLVTGELNLDAGEISIAKAQGTYATQEVRLLAPTRIHTQNGLRIDSVKLGAQKAEVDVEGQFLPELDLHASLRQLTPALINVFFPDLLAAGSIEGHADLRGSVRKPEGEVVLNAAGIRMAADEAIGLPAADVHIKAQLRGDVADIDARMDAGSESHLTAAGLLPMAQDGPIDMKVAGKLDFSLLNPLLEARGGHAAGQLSIDASIGGSMAEPQFGGSVNLVRGSLVDYVRGISLSDITAQIIGEAGTLEIKSFTASAPPGQLSMTGTVGISRSALPVELKITARNAQPIASKLITANLDADIKVSGTLRERLDIAGNVNLNRTDIGIPNGLPPNVAVLDVRRRGKTVAPAANGKPLVIGLNLSVKAPREIIVKGRGLDAQMGGELQIGGTTDTPRVDGGFDLQRGSLSLSSSRLNFTAGRVSFNGQGLKNNIDPTLDFTAQTSVGETTAIVRITGLADAPVFEFSSTPSMPQDEILSLLLFGLPGSQLSALQHVQIGMALASLSGVGGDGSLNPLVKVQKSLGLDRLSVGAAAGTATTPGTENTGASIQAGRYINSRLYVEARQSTNGFSQVEADVEINKHLKLQTRLGNGTATIQGTTPDNDPGSSIGLIYQFEY